MLSQVPHGKTWMNSTTIKGEYMLRIKTKWTLKRNPKDVQTTSQTFLDVKHYRDYQTIMQKRGYQGDLVEVIDLDNKEKAQVDGDKIIFGGPKNA